MWSYQEHLAGWSGWGCVGDGSWLCGSGVGIMGWESCCLCCDCGCSGDHYYYYDYFYCCFGLIHEWNPWWKCQAVH